MLPSVAKEEGFESWDDAFQYHFYWAPIRDIDKPVMKPWRLTAMTDTVKELQRNPYFYEVDTAGQQLPYVDRIVSTIVDKELYNLNIVAGESDVAVINTSVDNWTLYKQNEEAGGYTVYPIPGVLSSDAAFGVNQNHSDPALRRILNDVRFRQALSLAINREEINKVVYHGLGTPTQATHAAVIELLSGGVGAGVCPVRSGRGQSSARRAGPHRPRPQRLPVCARTASHCRSRSSTESRPRFPPVIWSWSRSTGKTWGWRC